MLVLSYIEADHAIVNINDIANVPLQSMDELSAPWLYPVDEQQFWKLSCVHVHYPIFIVVKLDL